MRRILPAWSAVTLAMLALYFGRLRNVGFDAGMRIIERLQDFLAVLENQSVAGALWIVEPGRVRVHLRDDER